MICVGVTVLLEPPLVDDINNTIPGAKEFPHPVTPSDARESTDPTSIGFTFTVSEDKSVTRYGNVYIRTNIMLTVWCNGVYIRFKIVLTVGCNRVYIRFKIVLTVGCWVVI